MDQRQENSCSGAAPRRPPARPARCTAACPGGCQELPRSCSEAGGHPALDLVHLLETSARGVNAAGVAVVGVLRAGRGRVAEVGLGSGLFNHAASGVPSHSTCSAAAPPTQQRQAARSFKSKQRPRRSAYSPAAAASTPPSSPLLPSRAMRQHSHLLSVLAVAPPAALVVKHAEPGVEAAAGGKAKAGG